MYINIYIYMWEREAPLGSIWRPICLLRTTYFNYLVTTTFEIIEISEILFFYWIRRNPHHFNYWNNWKTWKNWNEPDFKHVNYLGPPTFEIIEIGPISIISIIEIPDSVGWDPSKTGFQLFQLFGGHNFWNNWNPLLLLDKEKTPPFQ